MILTQCPACAAPLPDLTAKQCSRCKTRYCGPACQKKHWEEGGHDKLCRAIKKAGGAEQYNANQKHTAAITVAVEACAEDTNGQTCYICTQALHWKTKEGLVRGCSCRGTAGFAHVSCLAEQAKILFDEAMENNLDWKAMIERWARWYNCSLCEQQYHSVVKCALGWACWKTYLGRPETDWARSSAMTQLGNGLHDVKCFQDALSVQEAELSTKRRLGAPDESILTVQGNLANTYEKLKRNEEALRMLQDVYSGRLELNGKENEETLRAANNYASTLNVLKRFEEAKALLRKTIPVARRVLSEGHRLTLKMRKNYAKALFRDPSATLDDLREAVTSLEEMAQTARRVFGGAHPLTVDIEESLRRAALAAREGTKIK
jgi:tetratricopeptide (TPR) repeat protein